MRDRADRFLASSSPFPGPWIFDRWLVFLLVFDVFPSPLIRPPFLIYLTTDYCKENRTRRQTVKCKQMCLSPFLTGLKKCVLFSQAKNKCVLFSQRWKNVSYSHRDEQMCPIFTFCRRVSYLGRSCPVELLRLGKRFLTCIFHFKKMSFVSYSTSCQFICVLSVKPPKLPQDLAAGVSCLTYK